MQLKAVERVRKLKELQPQPVDDSSSSYLDENLGKEDIQEAWTNFNRVFEAELGLSDVSTMS